MLRHTGKHLGHCHYRHHCFCETTGQGRPGLAEKHLPESPSVSPTHPCRTPSSLPFPLGVISTLIKMTSLDCSEEQPTEKEEVQPGDSGVPCEDMQVWEAWKI